MSRLTVFEFPGGSDFDFVLNLQSDLVTLSTIVVAPMYRRNMVDGNLAQGIEVEVDFKGGIYIVQLHQMAAVKVTSLGDSVGRLDENYWQSVLSSIDFLFTGFS